MIPRPSASRFAPLGQVTLLVLALSAPATALGAGPAGYWSQLPVPPSPTSPPHPSARLYTGAVYDPDGERMVVFGGNPEVLNDVWQLTLTGPANWTAIVPTGSTPSARWGHAAVYDPVRKRMLVMGGFDGSNNLNDLHALSLTGPAQWTPMSAAGAWPPGRRNHLMLYDPPRDRILVFGGYTGSFVNDVWALNLSGPPAWTLLAVSGSPPSGRNLSAGVYDPVGDRIVLYGGWNGVDYEDDVWELSLAGSPAWTELFPTGTAPLGRRDHVAVYDAAAHRIVYFGGRIGDPIDELWSLGLSGTPAWTSLSPGGGPTARYSHAAVFDAAGNRMVVFGGYDGNFLADAWGLDLSVGSEAWQLISEPPPPPATGAYPLANCDYAAVYDQGRNRVLHIGGKRNSGLVPTHSLELGGAPEWTPFADVDAASRRNAHSAVLDLAGDRAIVFGGYNGAYLNDVRSMNLSGPPVWSQVIPAGTTPSPRMYHTAIADPVRQRMVVFGGHPTVLNDVHALNFTGAPTWSELTPAGTPPPPRWGHCAVYDPLRDRMIVFGGLDSQDQNINDVWALDFAPSPAWVPVVPAGTPPTGRRNATLVYDSARDRLILFGGYGPDFRNDLWELSLGNTPTWTQLAPTGGPPLPRNQMTATYEPLLDRVALFGGWFNEFLGDTWLLDFGQPTAALVSLVRAEATSDGVNLVWQIGEGSDPAVAIERSADGASWRRVADANPDGTGLVSWTDFGAPDGRRVGYRILFAGSDGPSSGGEVWVDVPARAPLAIESVRPNPAGERALIGLTLPGRQRATLDAIDLAGRRVLSRDLGSLSAGRHDVILDDTSQWPAGLYLLRLQSGGRLATARLMVVR